VLIWTLVCLTLTIRFGWYIPTHGDLTNFADPDQFIPASMEMSERVALARMIAAFDRHLPGSGDGGRRTVPQRQSSECRRRGINPI
jgi:hypothetical protein